MAEGARLESVYAGNRIEGSNPSPSARTLSSTFPDLLLIDCSVSVFYCRIPMRSKAFLPVLCYICILKRILCGASGYGTAKE